MTIENRETVDLIGTEKNGEGVVLVISDHLDWSDPDGHLALLQEKINTYLGFVASQEMLEQYPQAAGRKPVFEIVGAHALAPEGVEFFERVRPLLEAAGVELRFARLEGEAS